MGDANSPMIAGSAVAILLLELIFRAALVGIGLVYRKFVFARTAASNTIKL